MMMLGLCSMAQVRGDVSGDGAVDVGDVNIVVNIILGKAYAANYPGNADINNDGTVDVGDVNIVVNIILGKESAAGTITFTRVTSANQLVAGKRYLIVCETYSGAMGGMKPGYENYRALVESGITLDNGTATVGDNSEVSIFTLGGTMGSWTLCDGDYYLANSSASQLNSVTSVTDNSARWTVTFGGNNAVITNKKNTSKTIYYQSRYADFNASASGTEVQLYVEGTINDSIDTPDIPGNNANANWCETAYNIPESSANATTSSATYGMAWRLEYPHITPDDNSTVIVHASSDYGISYSLELAKSQRANRWSCFAMHNGTPNNDVGRSASSFSTESCVEAAYQVSNHEYTDGNYTKSSTNLDGSNMTTFARGHICASEDRQSSEAQNRFTFITSNCHPQYQAHNAGLWQRMEAKVQTWGYSTAFRDTIYVCKGATIADVTLNGSTVSGTIPASEVKAKYGVNITGSLVIPRYWFMAVLCLKGGQYHAMAYWTEQINSSCSSTTLPSCMISIDELERRTGIDFFCNLPDDIEADVESSLDTGFWQ